MVSITQFQRGDLVVHPRRPEWGHGVVDQAASIQHEGQSAQRLVVTFVNYGRVTINTAVAPLLPKGAASVTFQPTILSSASAAADKAWKDAVTKPKANGDELWRLPEAMTDPFAGIGKRLQATLDSYRYSDDPRQAWSLLEWAMAQTGLDDPLSTYTRHELEQAFPRYARERDNHLVSLIRQIKKDGRTDLLEQALASAAPVARNALQRAMRN